MAHHAAIADRAKHVADAVYGTILVLAVVAAISKDEEAAPGAILGAALATSLVFWLVHVYAAVLARRAAGDLARLATLAREAAREEWPLVEAAIAPTIPLLVGEIGLFSRSTSITLAILVGLADLAGWGYLAGRAMRQSPWRSALSAAGAVALGTVMVLLKNALH